LPGKKSKYRAVRTDGFASKKEAKRAAELELLEKQGKIYCLVKQKPFHLMDKEGDMPAVTYIADFFYFDKGKQEWIAEDVKGFRTPVYKLKRRLLWAFTGIRITEI
jgi:hypothetical protein